MSLSLPRRYAFFSGACPVRIINRSNNLCFAVSAVRTSHRNTKLFPQPILFLRHVTTTPRSNLEILRDYRAHASSIEYEDSNSSSSFDVSSFVSVAEVLCIVSSAVISVVLAVNYAVVGEIGRKASGETGDPVSSHPRKALKEPLSETAALAQKNSEATRVLAAQQEILEKELGEIQKVLLAMQDQQRKQLELILTIAKNGKLFENINSKQASE